MPGPRRPSVRTDRPPMPRAARTPRWRWRGFDCRHAAGEPAVRFRTMTCDWRIVMPKGQSSKEQQPRDMRKDRLAGRAPARLPLTRRDRHRRPHNSPGNIHRKLRTFNSLKYNKENVRRQFLSVRQDAFGRQSLCSMIGPEKPRNAAVSGERLCTSVGPSRSKTPLSVAGFLRGCSPRPFGTHSDFVIKSIA